MEFSVQTLGTGSAMPMPERYQSAQVLRVHGRSFLIDCGEGTQYRMRAEGISPLKIDSVFISHIHGDHLFGLFPLLSTMGMLGRTQALRVFAPASFGPLLKFFLSWFGEGIPYEVRHIPLTMKQPECVDETRSMAVFAFPLRHKIDTFGFLFREKEPPRNLRKDALERYGFTRSEIGRLKQGEDILRPAGPDTGADFLNGFVRHSGTDEPLLIPAGDVTYRPYVPRSYAYCSDTAPFPELAEWVKDVDVLYHETTYLEAMADQAALRHHSTTLQAARCALDAHARMLLVGHYSSRCGAASLFEAECRTVFPDTVAATDGMKLEIPFRNSAENA